jgi:hypothetical protein
MPSSQFKRVRTEGRCKFVLRPLVLLPSEIFSVNGDWPGGAGNKLGQERGVEYQHKGLL